MTCHNRISFLLARPSQDVFLLHLIPCVGHGGRILLVALLNDDLFCGLANCNFNGRSETGFFVSRAPASLVELKFWQSQASLSWKDRLK